MVARFGMEPRDWLLTVLLTVVAVGWFVWVDPFDEPRGPVAPVPVPLERVHPAP